MARAEADPPAVCAICLRERITDPCILNPCAHEFCVDCAAAWARRADTCPLCKQAFDSAVVDLVFLSPDQPPRFTTLSRDQLAQLKPRHPSLAPLQGLQHLASLPKYLPEPGHADFRRLCYRLGWLAHVDPSYAAPRKRKQSRPKKRQLLASQNTAGDDSHLERFVRRELRSLFAALHQEHSDEDVTLLTRVLVALLARRASQEELLHTIHEWVLDTVAANVLHNALTIFTALGSTRLRFDKHAHWPDYDDELARRATPSSSSSSPPPRAPHKRAKPS